MPNNIIKQIRLKDGNEYVNYDIGADATNIAYDSETNIKDKIDSKANSSHTHTKSNITDFTHTHTKSDITDFAHTHTKANITDFAHTHTKSDITNFPILKKFQKNVSLSYGSTRNISLDMQDYIYNENDIIFVYINGLFGIQDTDWTLNAISSPTITINTPGSSGNSEQINIIVLQL